MIEVKGEEHRIEKGMKWWFLGLPLLFTFPMSLFTSCGEPAEHTAPPIYDRDSASMMVSYGVNTLISDSGVIKYRIVTERWDVNTVREPSRWTFEKGVFFEQFDEKFHVQAYVQADTAWYFDQKNQSEELYWDGMRHELYSNVFSRVTTPERTMEGTYFLSDEQMTHYTVSNSKGSFEREDITGDEKPQEQNSAADTVKAPEPVLRPQTQKHARRN